MRYSLLLLLFIFFATVNAQSLQEITLSVGFSSGSSDLDKKAISLLSALVDTLQQEGVNINRVSISGHTDIEGNAAANELLSEQRVNSVIDYLRENEVRLTSLRTGFFGEKRPVSLSRHELNRRVEIVILLDDLGRELSSFTVVDTLKVAEDVPQEPIDYLDRSELQVLLAEKLVPKRFRIPVNVTSSFKTKSGLIFSFPADAFADYCIDSVTLIVEEYNEAQSMVKGNMTTTSDGRLLYSIGMFDIRAYCAEGGKEVNVQKDYTVFVPYAQKDGERMPREVFSFMGIRDSLTRAVNWQQDSYKRQEPLLGNWMCGSRKGCQFFNNLFLSRRERQAFRRSEIERKKIANRYANVDFVDVENLVADEVHYYVFESSRMGLTNYDLFWKLPPDKLIDQEVTLSEPIVNNTEVMLYFKNRRSMVAPTRYYRSHVVFPQIPKGEPVYVIALKTQEKTKRIQVGIQEMNVDGERINVTLSEVPSLEVLDMLLSTIKG
jgi:hypothetical protein